MACAATTQARRVVIAGAGYAGTSCAVKLGHALRDSDDPDVLIVLAGESGLDPRDLNVNLVEGRDRILPELTVKERAAAMRRLARMNVTVVTGAFVDRVEADVVRLADGRAVDGHVLVRAGGARADPRAREWGMETTKDGRVRVDGTLRLPGHPEVYAIGDVAAARSLSNEHPLPMLPQVAIQEGPEAASNICSRRAARSRGRSCRTSAGSSSASGRAGAWDGCTTSRSPASRRSR